MKTKRKISTSIWTRPPKGIRAGNSPIWITNKKTGESMDLKEYGRKNLMSVREAIENKKKAKEAGIEIMDMDED